MTTEIKALGNMLAATDADDAPRLLAISKRVEEIANNSVNPPCSECRGMGWVPSKTEADTDPCPKCEGGFSTQNR